jgi:hypothetical protein
MKVIILCICLLSFSQQVLPDVQWSKTIATVKQEGLRGLNMATEIGKVCTQVLSLTAMGQWFEFKFKI